ncbi:ATP-binding protein [Candidatus Omnitrophota bacterium]
MPIFALSGLVNAIAVGMLGLLVFFKDRKVTINRKYALFCFVVTIWSLAYFLWQISDSREDALLWLRVLMAGAMFIPVSFMDFVFILLYGGKYKKHKKNINLSYLLFFIFLLLDFTPLFIKDVILKLSFKFWPVPGISFAPFLIIWIIYCIYPIYIMLAKYKNTRGLTREQIKYVTIGMTFGYLGGATNYFLWYDVPILPYGNFIIPIAVGFMAYAIIRFRLMDIKLTITRTGIFITLYTLVLGLPFVLATAGKDWLIGLLGSSWWIGPLTSMAALATAGPFIYIFLQRRAEAILLREQRRYQDTLKQAAVGMTRIRDLGNLLNLVVHIVTKTVRISHSAIYLFEKDSGEFLLKAGRNLKKNLPASISSNSSLVIWLHNQKEPLVYDEIKRKSQETPTLIFKELETQMRLIDASVLVPSFLEDRLLGLLILGNKRSGAIYTTEDLDVFSVLGSQAALAIENAQFILEAQAMQEQIAQAEKMATVGTMADGLSHQINNRLHALSMITGDTLDTLKLANSETFPAEAKEILGQVAHALERIQANVIQGREVVSGLLKYSRKGEEGLAAVSIDEIIDGSLEMVKFKVKLSEIDLVREYPQDLNKIKANLTQLQEVFFNLIDNAYDAMKERKDTLKEEGYRGKITISAENPDNGFLRIIFADNGIGVKKEDNRKVFTPFFTTKVSSRRGTGLGLFVIQRIITQMHQGRIQFDSEYGKGTKFILELPVAK